MDRIIFVHIDINGATHSVGRLHARFQKGKETASFEYDKEWISRKEAFPLEPAMMLDSGPLHTAAGRSTFGAFGDSAPDRWGRTLMKRAEKRAATREKRAVRTLSEADYLLMVNDEARMGALRFSVEEGGPFLASGSAPSIPPLVDLPRLLAATQDVLEDKETEEDLRVLLDPGGSLGGHRPKASVRDKQGQLAVAKFPRKDDEFQIESWEMVTLNLAEKAGIQVPERQIETILGRPVIILKRFDRTPDGNRIPFLSAMSMLQAQDNEPRSYMEIADALSQYGARPREDKRELWQRIVFNVLVSNTDDHLRNHGFLHQYTAGWVLSPAYDINPVPDGPHMLKTSIGPDDSSASLNIALEHAEYFEIDKKEAKEIASRIANVTQGWREQAEKLKISGGEIERMSSAFEHSEAEQASFLSIS